MAFRKSRIFNLRSKTNFTSCLCLGSQAEKTELKQSIDSTERFCRDVVDITSSQSKEIADLQRSTLELLTWVDDAKSRDVRNRNPK